jgi:hypothetical protein
MAINYQRLADTAKRLITDNAQGTIDIGRSVSTPGAQPWDAPTITTTYTTVKGVVSGVAAKFVDGETVMATDLQVIAYIADYAPLPGDIMRIDGKAVAIISQEKIPGAGIIAAWRFIVRA